MAKSQFASPQEPSLVKISPDEDEVGRGGTLLLLINRYGDRKGFHR
jgi:hypothetical protein